MTLSSSSARGDLSLGEVLWGEEAGGLGSDLGYGWGACQLCVHSPQSPGPTRVGCPHLALCMASTTFHWSTAGAAP